MRPYRSLPFISSLVRLGLTATERPYDEQTERIAAKLKPDLIFVVLDPEHPDAVSAVERFVRNSTAFVVVLGPGPQTTGFSGLLAAGADLCLRETDPPELIAAQLGALLRRLEQPAAEDDGILRCADLTIDRRRCEVTWRDVAVPLSPMEFRVLQYLAERPGRVVSAHELMRAVHDYVPSAREARDSAKVYVRRIRKKLETAGDSAQRISTVRGFGYFLDVPTEGVEAAPGVATSDATVEEVARSR